MPRSRDPDALLRHQLPDEARQAAFDACAAARRLENLLGEKLWRPKMLIPAAVADLRDAQVRLRDADARIAAILTATGHQP